MRGNTTPPPGPRRVPSEREPGPDRPPRERPAPTRSPRLRAEPLREPTAKAGRSNSSFSRIPLDALLGVSWRGHHPTSTWVHGGDRRPAGRPRGPAVRAGDSTPRRGREGLSSGTSRRAAERLAARDPEDLSLIHISEPTRRTPISYAVF